MATRKRKWITALMVTMGLLLLAIVTLPFWITAAIRPVARVAGVRFEKLERVGDDLLFSSVRAEQEGFTLTANSIQTPQIAEWWSIYRNGVEPGNSNTVLSAKGWKLTLKQRPGSQPQKDGKSASAVEVFEEVKEVIERLNRTVPNARLANGKVVAGKREYTFGNITWHNGALQSDVHWPELVGLAEVRAELPPEGPYRAALRINALELSLRVSLAKENDGWSVASTNIYKGNRFRAHAFFVGDGALPKTGTLAAKNLKLDGKLFGLEEIAQIRGTINVEFRPETYSINTDLAFHTTIADEFGSSSGFADDNAAPPHSAVMLRAEGSKSDNKLAPAPIQSGKITLGAMEFAIAEGAIEPTLIGKFIPVVHLVGHAETNGHNLTLLVKGIANRPEVNLSSVPPMTPDAMRRLTSGAMKSEVAAGR